MCVLYIANYAFVWRHMGDKTMKRRLTVILLSLTLIFTLIPMTAFAEELGDIDYPLIAKEGDHFTVGSVTVNNEELAIDCCSSKEGNGADAFVKVKGNVFIDGGTEKDVAAVKAYSEKGKATVDIGGNLTAKAKNASYGIDSDTASIVKVGGDVSVESTGTTYKADATGVGITAGGQDVEGGQNGEIQIGGNFSVKGFSADGIYNGACFNEPINETFKISVGKNITVTSTGSGTQPHARGIYLAINDIKTNIDVGGDVTVVSNIGKGDGVYVSSGSNTGNNEKTNVTIHGNMISDFGIRSEVSEYPQPADICVEGTIEANDVAVALYIPQYITNASINTSTDITAWKINPNSGGNVAEIVDEKEPDNRTVASDVEKNIKYIIKYKQPSKGGTLYAVNSSGNALAKSHGYSVAKEGDKIVVKAKLDSGWKLKSVYDNDIALDKDANGNFYLIVPKGGGILLSADLEEPGSDPTQMGSDGTAVGEGASAAAADQKITGMKTDTDPKGSKFNKLRLRSTYQTKTSITLKWKSNKKAEKYVIYGNRCGTSTKIRKSVKLYTVKKSTKTTMTKVIKKVKGAAVKKNTYYKFLVVALDKNNKVVSTSRMIHVATKGGKYTNYKKISVDKEKITKAKNLKKGKSLKLEAKQIKVTKSLKARKHVPIRYESSNKTIAKVTSKGVIKALKKGTCYVYIYAQNGVYKKIKVVVK